MNTLAMPEGLSEQGRRAYEIILAYLTEHGLSKPADDNDATFHEPKGWNQEYGGRSLLVISHRGGPLGPVFSMDFAYDHDCANYRKTGKTREPYALYEGMQEKLREAGLYFEDCTRWYSAVYSIHGSTRDAEDD
ncbi:MAG TPA: hypothetical protein VLE97_06330 [Gaiellaceae bacterium]|nr:hypothetical protein [Gaiellaceae bacterium]